MSSPIPSGYAANGSQLLTVTFTLSQVCNTPVLNSFTSDLRLRFPSPKSALRGFARIMMASTTSAADSEDRLMFYVARWIPSVLFFSASDSYLPSARLLVLICYLALRRRIAAHSDRLAVARRNESRIVGFSSHGVMPQRQSFFPAADTAYLRAPRCSYGVHHLWPMRG